MAGDFRKTLLIIIKSTRADVIKVFLKSSPLWQSTETLNLCMNRRAYLSNNQDGNFLQKILLLGDRKLSFPIAIISQVLLDNALVQTVHSLEILVDTIYSDIKNFTERYFNWLCSRAIVLLRNDSINEIKKMIMEKVPGDCKYYKFIDTVCNIEDIIYYPQKFLNSLNPTGFPLHKLKLKLGTPIILLKNLSPSSICKTFDKQLMRQCDCSNNHYLPKFLHIRGIQ